jgi:hypothetical protein
MAGDLYAPLRSSRVSAFATRCVEDGCGRVRAYQFKDGLIGPEIELRRIAHLTEMRLAHGPLELVADLLRDAAELQVFGRTKTDPDARDAAYRGAAVHLRVAMEVLLGAYVLGLSDEERRPLRLSGIRKRIDRGSGWNRIKKGQRKVLSGAITYLTDLGDTAAHPLLSVSARETPATRGTVVRGFDEFEKMLGAVKLPGVSS